MMRVVTFKAENDLLDIIDYYANIKKLNKSEAIRDLIQKGFQYYQEKEDKPVSIKVERLKL